MENEPKEPMTAPAEAENAAAEKELETKRPAAEQAPAAEELARESEEPPAEEKNPFDFREEEGSETEKKGGGNEEKTEQYELEFGESFGGTDSVREMITRHASESGLDARAASRFVRAVCDSLAASQQEQAVADYESLERSWGRDFQANMEGTRRLLNEMYRSGKLTEEDLPALMNPSVFRLVNAMRSARGEERAAGTQAARSAATKKAELDDILNNPDNEYHQILMNPYHGRYREAAEHANDLAGMRLY